MTISTEGLIDGAPGSLKKLADRVQTEINGLAGNDTDTLVGNQALYDMITDTITGLDALGDQVLDLQFDGVTASGELTSILQELVTRIIAVEAV